MLRREAKIVGPVVVVLAAAVLLAALGYFLMCSAAKPGGDSRKPLVIYCAASNKGVLEAIRRDYEREFHIPLEIQYGPSQTLLASLEISKTGDIYLPADDSYLKLAGARGLLAEQFPLARMQGVVAVTKGNPKKIHQLADVLAPDVRIAQGNVEASAIGKLTREVLSARGKWDALAAHTTVFKTTVNDVANDVALGAVDAGIVYDVVVHDYPAVEAVRVPELADLQARVAVAVLKSSSQPQQALEFARYLSTKGLARYRDFGFQPADGGTWPAPANGKPAGSKP